MSRFGAPRAAALVLAAFATWAAATHVPAADAPPADPIAAELARSRAFVSDSRDSSEFWQQVRDGSVGMLDRTARALDTGRRLAALHRLGAARTNLRAYEFVMRRPGGSLTDTTGLAAAWRREGDSLHAMPPATAGRARGLRPAAVRALAETAIPQVRNYYDASYDYAISTEPRFGWFYMGVARAQREYFDLCLSLAGAGGAPPAAEPAIRSIAAELDSLEAHVLSAYRPPLSIDRHGEFIGVSSALKEARELESAGLHHGALVRYLLAVLRFAPLRPPGAPIDSGAALARLDAFEAQLATDGRDHSIARLFLETARLEIESAPAGRSSPVAVGVATDVLPLYLAAIGPTRPAAARPAVRPSVTVTLVRWPYT